MAGMNLGGAGAASAGADALEQLLTRLATEGFRRKQQAQEQERIAIEQQRADQGAKFQDAQLQQLSEERAARADATRQASADRLEGSLNIGDTLDTGQSGALKGAMRGNLVKHQDATPTIPTLANPMTGRLMMPSVAGQAARDTYAGNPAQQQAARQREALQGLLNDPNTPEPFKAWIRATDGRTPPPSELFKQEKPTQKVVAPGGYVLDDNNKPVFHAPDRPHEAPTVVIQTVDEEGNPISKIVRKEEGASYRKPVGATMELRLKSAKAVKQTGDDIIAQMSDPKVQATLGPAMGRFSSIRDFVGNPPPEFSELAGQIESFALANMGVHGMRSAQGAEKIKELLDQKHTPQSLAAAVRGLNHFSEHFLANDGRGGTPQTATGGSDPLGIRKP